MELLTPWLGCALCKLAGLSGVVAAYVAFIVTARNHPSPSRCVVSFSFMLCSAHNISLGLLLLVAMQQADHHPQGIVCSRAVTEQET